MLVIRALRYGILASFLTVATAFAGTTLDGTWSMHGTFGGPGSTGNELYVAVLNTVGIDAATIEVHFDSLVIPMDKNVTVALNRFTDMTLTPGNITSFQNTLPGVYRRFVSFGGNGIEAGTGDILKLAFAVASNVTTGAQTTITLTDQGAAHTLATLTLTITQTVKRVTIESPADGASFSVDEGRNLTLRFQVTNQGTSLTLNKGTLPTGALMPGDTLFQWTPGQNQAGAYPLRFIYSNETGFADTVNLNITVNDRNATPAWPAQTDTLRVNEGQALSHSFTAATDADPTDFITYSPLNLPSGAVFSSGALQLSWTPVFGKAGTYQFSLVATDNNGARATKIFTVIVAKVNRKPSLKLTATTVNVSERDAIQVGVTASDPDGDPVRVTASGLPESALFSGGVFSWNKPVPGNYTVKFIGSDPGGLADSQSVAISVTSFNYPPYFVGLSDTTIDAAQAVQITLLASDPNTGDQLTYSVHKRGTETTLLDRGATLSGNVLSWTPATTDIGPNLVLLRVSDSQGAFADGQLTITVTGRNIKIPPSFKPLEDQNLTESQSFVFYLPLAQGIQTGLRFWAQNWPEGSTLDSLSGRFAWVPTLSQSGSYTVTFGVTDGNFQDSKSMRLLVAERDVFPVLANIPNVTIKEDSVLKLRLSAIDSSGEAVSFSAENLPSGAEFFPQGLLKYRPAFDQSGVSTITFVVTDASGNTDQQTVSLTVQDVNRPPDLVTEDQQVSEEATLIFSVSATDPDGDAVTYAARNVPQGAQFDQNSGGFQWTPTTEQGGNYEVMFSASDPAGSVDSATVIISVGNVNRPPRIDPVGDQVVAEGETLSLGVVASDPDAGNRLSFTFSGLPRGAAVTTSGTNPATATVNLTPGYTQAGVYEIKVAATDNDATDPLSVSRGFKLQVTDVDVAPAFSGVLAGADSTVMSAEEGQVLSFDVAAGDAGGDALGFSALSLPLNAVANLVSSPRSVVFYPAFNQSGRQVILLAVTDGVTVVTKTVIVNVEEVNRPPRVPQIADQSVNEGDFITFAVNADDPDGDALQVFSAGRVPFLTLGSNPPARIRDGNVFLFDTALLPKNQPIESAVFRFWAVDSRDGVSDSVNVEIKVVRKDSVNVPPGGPFTLDSNIGGPLGIGFSVSGSSGNGRIRFSSQSGFANNFNWTPSLASVSDEESGKKKKGVYTYLSGDLESQFYGIRRGWGLDLTALATAGSDSFPSGLSGGVTLSYFDADLPTEVPSFTESRLKVFGYDILKGTWVQMDSMVIDTLKNEAFFVPTDPRIVDYTIGAVLDLVAPQITNVKFVSGGVTLTPAPLDTLRGLGGTYEVRVNITDDNVVSSTDAMFYYALNSGSFNELPLTRQPGNLFVATLQTGALVEGATIDYYVVAQDTMNVVTLPSNAPQSTYRLILKEQTQVAGDVDGNNKIDVFDLLQLLKVLGGSATPSFASDLDHNGKTDVFDLLALLKKLSGN